MPGHFDGQIIEDAVQCIRLSDLVAEDAKVQLIRRMQSLREVSCTAAPSCTVCHLSRQCVDRIGAILNGEA